jgi:WD40 repeat protein
MLQTLQGHKDRVWGVSLSSDGQIVASCSFDKTVRVWSVRDGKELQILQGHTNFVKSVSLSLDSQMVISGADDKTVRIWRVSDGKCLHVLGEFHSEILSVALQESKNNKHTAYLSLGCADGNVLCFKMIRYYSGDFMFYLMWQSHAFLLANQLRVKDSRLDELALKLLAQRGAEKDNQTQISDATRMTQIGIFGAKQTIPLSKPLISPSKVPN